MLACERDKRIRAKADHGYTLIVAPKSVFSVWEYHFAEHCPELRVVTYDTKHKAASFDLAALADVLIINYEALAKNLQELKRFEWLHVILDEAHRVKSRKAQQTQAAKALPAEWKTLLTGTPITNKPDDLWSLLHYMYPKDYRSYWKHIGRYCATALNREGGYMEILGPKNEKELQDKIAPYYCRRLKRIELPSLPDKYYSTISVTLEPKQRRAYNEMRREMISWVGANEDQPVIAAVSVAKLTRMEQFTAAYAEIDPLSGKVKLSEPSAKLDALMQLIEDNPEQQIVVWSKFSQVIKLAAKRLEAHNISHAVLTGDTPQDRRGALIERFQAGETQVFLGTIRAGGVGVTLTAAWTEVFLDREWSPADNAQAEDRLHRNGQKNAVHVIDIIARDSVDRRKGERLELKWSWVKRVLGE